MELTYLRNVTTLKLDFEKCTGCGMCIKVCPHEVFEISGKKSVIKEKDDCMECGACAKNCPEQALEVDAGVGCAAAIIIGALTGKDPTCGPACCSSGVKEEKKECDSNCCCSQDTEKKTEKCCNHQQ